MTATRTKKWKCEGDNTFVKWFGPIKATVCRKWGMSPEPTEYYAFLNVGDERFAVPISELGVRWFEDAAEKIACKLLEKQIKAYIRSWLR